MKSSKSTISSRQDFHQSKMLGSQIDHIGKIAQAMYNPIFTLGKKTSTD
jgi:hypothetical protein